MAPAGYFGADARRVLAGSAPPRRHPERPAVGAVTLRAARPPGPRRGRAARRPRRARAATASGLALPAGEAFCVALHGCLLAGAVAVPIDLRLGAHERAALTAGDVAGRRRAAARRGRRAAARRAPSTTSTRPRSSSTRPARRGAPKPVELTYGNWLWSALGLGRRARRRPGRALAVHAAAHARRRPVDPPAQRDLRARRRRLHERFDTERVLAELRDPGGPTLVSLVPDDARAAARRRAARAARAALGAAGRRAAAAGAARARGRAAGVPVAPTYGLTEACSQVTTARRRRCSARASRSPTTARSSSRADRRARRRAGAAHGRPRGARRATGA